LVSEEYWGNKSPPGCKDRSWTMYERNFLFEVKNFVLFVMLSGVGASSGITQYFMVDVEVK
jgi:hypothetical protein